LQTTFFFAHTHSHSLSHTHTLGIQVGGTKIRRSKLHLVDLAGSERVKNTEVYIYTHTYIYIYIHMHIHIHIHISIHIHMHIHIHICTHIFIHIHVCATQVEGKLFTEAVSINLSLMYLKQVIVALHQASRGRGGDTYIPYRNSLMTSVLRDSLGGASAVVKWGVCACVCVWECSM
jgi:hypothetical protein